MEYSKDLIIPSDSGYCFPFVAFEDNPVSVILDYGEQINPSTGQKFNHTGIDFSVSKGSPLYALADGMVTGIGDDDVHGHTITARYGNFYVIYGHVSECLREYGERVRARDVIARSGSFVHLGVLYKGEVIDPKEFIDLIAANINELESLGEMMHSDKQNPTNTEYDQFSDEISVLFVRYFPSYMSALRTGTYRPSETFEEKMRSLFVSSASQNYFYEKAPTVANPLGLTDRAAPLVAKAQDLLITDFLHYVAVTHHIFISDWTDEQKKKLFSKAMVVSC
jgi:hypothetical protein